MFDLIIPLESLYDGVYRFKFTLYLFSVLQTSGYDNKMIRMQPEPPIPFGGRTSRKSSRLR